MCLLVKENHDGPYDGTCAITKGTNLDNFFITGYNWERFDSTHPSVIFYESWVAKLSLYEQRSTAAIFFNF